MYNTIHRNAIQCHTIYWKSAKPPPPQMPLLYLSSACGRHGNGLTYVCASRPRIYTEKAQTTHGARTTVGHMHRTLPDRLGDHNTKTTSPPAHHTSHAASGARLAHSRISQNAPDAVLATAETHACSQRNLRTGRRGRRARQGGRILGARPGSPRQPPALWPVRLMGTSTAAGRPAAPRAWDVAHQPATASPPRETRPHGPYSPREDPSDSYQK